MTRSRAQGSRSRRLKQRGGLHLLDVFSRWLVPFSILSLVPKKINCLYYILRKRPYQGEGPTFLSRATDGPRDSSDPFPWKSSSRLRASFRYERPSMTFSYKNNTFSVCPRRIKWHWRARDAVKDAVLSSVLKVTLFHPSSLTFLPNSIWFHNNPLFYWSLC